MRAALAVAAAAVAVVLALLLTHGTTRLAGSDDVTPDQFVITSVAKGTRLCQPGETLYAGTDRLRMTIGTFGKPGPRLAVELRDAHRRVVARGEVARGWKEGVVALPVSPAPKRSLAGGTVCLRQLERGKLAFAGEPADPSVGVRFDGKPQGARLSIQSLLAGRPSLLGIVDRVVERYEAGNARWLGAWTWVVMALAVLAALVLAGLALLRHARAPARLCAGVALLLSLTWALLIPPFMVPDEIAHVAYAQIVTETGKLPHEDYSKPVYSEQENMLLGGLQFYEVIGHVDNKPPWSAPEEAGLRAADKADAPRTGTNAATASSNPPLYYLLEAPVYGATRSASLLVQTLPMRLLSVLLAALTVLAVFAFLRELLPQASWTWTAGALVVAFQPVFGFITGGVNPDALLFALSALTFLASARILRRGLSVRRAALLGGAVAAGVLTKPLFLAVVPVALGAGVVALWRAREDRTLLLRAGAVGVAVAALPVVLYQVIGSAAFDHGYFASGTSAGGLVSGPANVPKGGLRYEVSYIWQLFLPRLPTMNELFPPPGTLPLYSTWFTGLVGRFGWLDYSFDPSVSRIAAGVALAVLAGAVATVVLRRDLLRGRWVEFAVYALGLVGIVLIVGTSQWRAFRTPGSSAFTQPRYLLPLLALYGALVAVALRGAGRRVGPVLAVAIVAIAALHELASLVLTITRYYA